jgi:hypothetical protein
MNSTAEFQDWVEWPDGASGATPAARFLEIYNRQLRRDVSAMEDWWVFGGFIADLEAPEDRLAAEALLKCVMASDAPGSMMFDRLCTALEAYALPGWARRMGADGADSFADLHPNQTGARLAALAALAEPLGWDVGDDLQATGLATVITTWHFDPPKGGERRVINVRAGRPRLAESPGDVPVIDFVMDIDFTLAPDEPAETAIRAAIDQLIQVTEQATASAMLVDLTLRRRLDALRRI